MSQPVYYVQTTDTRALVRVTAHGEEGGGEALQIVDTAGLPTLRFDLDCPLNERGQHDVRELCRVDWHNLLPLFNWPVGMQVE